MSSSKIEFPTETPPAGKKWWWRPTYYMGKGGNGKWEQHANCAFCGTKYDNDVPSTCPECKAVKVKPYGQCGFVNEDYNQQEIWA